MSALSVFVGGPNLADQGVLRPPPVVSGLSLWILGTYVSFWAVPNSRFFPTCGVGLRV